VISWPFCTIGSRRITFSFQVWNSDARDRRWWKWDKTCNYELNLLRHLALVRISHWDSSIFYLFRCKKLRYPTALKTKISAISTGPVLTQEWEKTKIVHAAGKLWFSMVYDQLRPNLMIKMFYILRWQWQMVTKSSSGPGIFAVRSSERMSFAYVHDAYLCFASLSVWRPNRLMAVFSWVIIFFQHLLLISECNYEIKRS